jgi:hypothetical protein
MDASPEGRPRRPRATPGPSCLILTAALSALAGAALAQPLPDCPAPRLTVAQDDRGLLVIRLEAPCAPYAPVRLTLGALAVDEETGIDGTLSATLPPLPGSGEVAVQVAGAELRAALPVLAATPFTAVIWPATGAWGSLSGATSTLRLGYPRPGSAPVDLAFGTGPVRIEAPVSESGCGRRLQAALLSDAAPQPVAVAVDLPDCAAVGQRVSIPLPR